jgi:hypothetical protein
MASRAFLAGRQHRRRGIRASFGCEVQRSADRASVVGAVLLLTAAGAGNAAAASTVTAGAVADTYSRSDHPNSNYGRTNRINVMAGSATAHGFLRFDVQLPAGATVTKATLRLHAQSQGGSSGITLRAASDPTWDERTLTWNNEPAPGASVVTRRRAMRKARGSRSTRPASSKATGLINVALTTGSGSRAFDSREASSSNRPQLVVDTQTATPTPTATPTSTATATPTSTATATPDVYGHGNPLGDPDGHADADADRQRSGGHDRR